MPKRYKIHKAPPQTEKEKQAAHQKQRINQADNSYLKNARALVPAGLLAVFLPGSLLWLVGQLPAVLPLWQAGQLSSVLPLWQGTAANTAVHLFGGGPTVLSRYGLAVVTLALQILLAPVTLLGFGGLCLRVWRGRRCSLARLFDPCRGGRLTAALGFSAAFVPLVMLPILLAAPLPRLTALPGGPDAGLLLGLATRLALYAVSLWLMLRLLPAPLLHLLEPRSPRATLRAAWALTAGQLDAMARYGLRLLIRAGVGLILYVLLVLVLMVLPLSGTALTLAVTAGGYLILALMAPLVVTGAIGYMDAWLPSDSQVRKRSHQADA